jgi:hypothetical protein
MESDGWILVDQFPGSYTFERGDQVVLLTLRYGEYRAEVPR